MQKKLNHRFIFAMLIFTATIAFSNMSWSANKDKVILFDVGGVLSQDVLTPVLNDLTNKFGTDIEKMKAAKSEFLHLADEGQLTDQEFWQKVLLVAGDEVTGTISTQSHIEYLKNFVTCNASVLNIAKKLKKRGYRIAILSNDSFEMAQARREKCGFDEVFGKKNIFISAEIAKDKVKPAEFIKPNEKIYTYTLEALKVTRDQVLFIDDNPKNIDAADKLGICGIEFKAAGDGVKREETQNTDEEELIKLLAVEGIQL